MWAQLQKYLTPSCLSLQSWNDTFSSCLPNHRCLPRRNSLRILDGGVEHCVLQFQSPSPNSKRIQNTSFMPSADRPPQSAPKRNFAGFVVQNCTAVDRTTSHCARLNVCCLGSVISITKHKIKSGLQQLPAVRKRKQHPIRGCRTSPQTICTVSAPTVARHPAYLSCIILLMGRFRSWRC